PFFEGAGNEIDVHPSILIKIKKGRTTSHAFGYVAESLVTVGMDEVYPHVFGHLHEMGAFFDGSRPTGFQKYGGLLAGLPAPRKEGNKRSNNEYSSCPVKQNT